MKRAMVSSGIARRAGPNPNPNQAHQHVAAVFDGGAPIGLRLAAARRPAAAVGDVGDDQVEVAQVLLVAGVGAV